MDLSCQKSTSLIEFNNRWIVKSIQSGADQLCQYFVMDMLAILNDSALANEVSTAVADTASTASRKRARKPEQILTDLESELEVTKRYDTSWKYKRLRQYEQKIAKLTAGINTQRANIAIINLKQTEMNDKAASSIPKLTWSDEQTIQLIGARRINDHHFVQHLQTKAKKWDLVADSYCGGFTLPKDMVIGENPTNITYKALSQEDHKTADQCQNRWKILAAEFRGINVMQSEQNIIALIRTKNYRPPSHRSDDELRGEVMQAISLRKEKFKFWENMNAVGWSLSDYLNEAESFRQNFFQ